MIEEAYCSFEVAKLLKEKGFDEPCRAVYKEEVLHINTLCDYYNSELSSYVCTPTQQMAMKWLREVHNISIELLTMHRNCWGYYVCKILDNTIEDLHDRNYFNTYEKAVEAALKYTLENLI